MTMTILAIAAVSIFVLFIQEKIMQGVALWGDDRETTKEGLRIAQIVPFILIWEEIGLLVFRTSDPTFWQNALLCAIILTYLIGILSAYRMIRNRIVQNQK